MEELDSLGARVVVIAQDDRQALKKLAEDSGLEYPILQDADGETIKRYGLWNQGFTRGVVPHPTALVVDEAGNVAWKRVDEDYTQRPPAEELVEVVRGLTAGTD